MEKSRDPNLIEVHQSTLCTLPYTLHYHKEDVTIAKRNMWWVSATNTGSSSPPSLHYLCFVISANLLTGLEGSGKHISISQINTQNYECDHTVIYK